MQVPTVLAGREASNSLHLAKVVACETPQNTPQFLSDLYKQLGIPPFGVIATRLRPPARCGVLHCHCLACHHARLQTTSIALVHTQSARRHVTTALPECICDQKMECPCSFSLYTISKYW
mmetsp:Transcript_5610/g.11430  ORF Transcript_5610/g.11430 Transcript_5610/m.11430 type:complete len:120 (+) Transcript_5610:41-400(+)